MVSRRWAGEIKGELLHIWGRQNPHVPLEGRNPIHARLEEADVGFQWHEVNGAMRFCETKGRDTIRLWLPSAVGLCSNCFTAGPSGETYSANRLDQRKPATEGGIPLLEIDAYRIRCALPIRCRRCHRLNRIHDCQTSCFDVSRKGERDGNAEQAAELL